MIHFLSRTHEDHPVWKKHFKKKATTYSGEGLKKTALRAIATKTPHSLAKDVFSEIRQKSQGKDVGGGIGEAINFFAGAASTALGFQEFKEFIGAGPDHRELPNEDKLFAKALSQVYKPVDERTPNVGSLERLTEYDTDRYSVYKEPNGQFLVAIHGTDFSDMGDVAEDLKIVVGAKVTDDSVQSLFDRLDDAGQSYDVVAHSLATQYVVNGTHENADRILLFNPASSPLQDGSYLEETANDPAYTYFVNPSDVVSKALWQKMSDETVARSYVANPKYSPVAAHSVSQWYEGFDEKVEEGEDTEDLGDYKANLRTRIRTDNATRD